MMSLHGKSQTCVVPCKAYYQFPFLLSLPSLPTPSYTNRRLWVRALFTSTQKNTGVILIMKDMGAMTLTTSRLAKITVVTAGVVLFFALDGTRRPLDQIAFSEMFSRQQSVRQVAGTITHPVNKCGNRWFTRSHPLLSLQQHEHASFSRSHQGAQPGSGKGSRTGGQATCHDFRPRKGKPYAGRMEDQFRVPREGRDVGEDHPIASDRERAGDERALHLVCAPRERAGGAQVVHISRYLSSALQ